MAKIGKREKAFAPGFIHEIAAGNKDFWAYYVIREMFDEYLYKLNVA